MGGGNIPSSLPLLPSPVVLCKEGDPMPSRLAQRGHLEESFTSDVICRNWLFGLQDFCKHFLILTHATVVHNSVIYRTKIGRSFPKVYGETLGGGTAASTWRSQDFPRTRCALFSGCA